MDDGNFGLLGAESAMGGSGRRTDHRSDYETACRTRIDQLAEEGDRAAARVKKLVAQPGRFLAVTQIGLTFLGFLASAYAAVNLTASLEKVLEPLIGNAAAAAALIVVTLLLSLFTIVFGELVPKSLALAHTEAFALRLSERRARLPPASLSGWSARVSPAGR